MINILFIGTFLSKQKGTYPVSENISINLANAGFSSYLCSSIENKFLRLIDIIFSSFFVKFDKMHIDVFSGPAFVISEFSSIIAKLKGKKIILTLHGGNLPIFYESNKSRIIRVFSRAHYIQTPSLSIQKFFFSEGIKIKYLPNPIDFKSFPFMRKNVKPKSILWVRAFSEIYNPDLAVETLHELKKNYPEATLTMIGPDKGSLSKIKNKINLLNLNSSVDIKGPVKNSDLYKYFQSHEVYINTTTVESFGVAVVEAASCGIPIVSTAVGELKFLWNHNKNILFADQNSNSFKKQIKKLFLSEDLKLKLTVNAKERIKEFDLNEIISEWNKIFSD
jgi:glycosyltransferase involved in cell wall biosynthesis